MNAYFARQPILDTNRQLYGYELLFRPNPDATTSGSNILVDGDKATTSVLDAVNWGGISKITAGAYGFVNFTENLILGGVATLYPKEYLVVEVLETVEMTNKVIHSLESLKEKGYKIALDDYVYRDSDSALFELCDIIKVEVDGTLQGYENLHAVAQRADTAHCRLLAEKVETQEVYERSRQLGCTLFQGYFFAKPKVMAERVVSPLKLNQLRLMRAISNPDIDFDRIAGIIKNDIGLSYKTLKLVNSAYYGLQNEITSINQAVVILGRNELRKWLVFSSLSTLGDDKPSELVIMSMTRAYFCEQVAKKTRRGKKLEAFFLAGLFSLLDTLTDTDLGTCLADMAVPPATSAALLKENNDGRWALDMITALENGDWDKVSTLRDKFGMRASQVSDLYLEAIEWARDFM